jgi:predicted transposase/invertase (TIGR01784 family)
MTTLNLLNPCVDLVFKNLIGQDKVACLGLICAILGWNENDVESFDFVDTHLIPADFDAKLGILDILVKLKEGTLINIELQSSFQTYYPKRALYYWASKYASQLEKGGKYSGLSKVIGIHILTQQQFKEYPGVHNIFDVCHRDTGFQAKMFNDFELHFIELEKFESVHQDALSKWCLFLKDPNMIDKELFTEAGLKRAYEELERMSSDKNQRAIYDSRIKMLRDIATEREAQRMEGKAEGIAEGRAEGKAEGRAEGIAEGRAQGKAEGRAEGIAHLVRKMYLNGINLDMIASSCELSLDEVQRIVNS